MTNEEIIKKIKEHKNNNTDFMALLYQQNLPLIRKICNQYANYGESMEDLLQQSYIGLFESVLHYDTNSDVKFTTYFPYWVKNEISKYLYENISLIRIPTKKKIIINKYNYLKHDFYKFYGRYPSDEEICKHLQINSLELANIKQYSSNLMSLDAVLENEDEDITLQDVIADEYNLEDDVIDNFYNEYQKNTLWKIVEDFTTIEENDVLKEYFINKNTMSEIGRKHNLSQQRIAQIRQNGLAKLRHTKSLRQIKEKLYIVQNRAYKSSFSRYKNNNFTSSVEEIALKKIELEERKNRVISEKIAN